MDIVDEREKISLNPGIVLNIEHKTEVGNVSRVIESVNKTIKLSF